MDLSVIVLEITASQAEAIAALKNAHNEAFVVTSEPRDTELGSREATPSIEVGQIQAVLRTDHYPFDPLLGWVFGSDEEQCDLLLGTRNQGVSGKHFRIDHNWKAMTLVLTNLSGNGTRWIHPITGEPEKIMTSRVILATEHYRIFIGVIDLTIRVPPRSEKQQAEYNLNIQRLRTEVEQATPTIGGLKVQTTDTATPVVVGRKRHFVLQGVIGSGATAIVYKAVDFETGDLFAAKEYNFDHPMEFGLRSMLNEIKILHNLRHKNIIEYIDVFRDPDPILIMELAIQSLEEHKIARVEDCVILLNQILRGVAYLHQKGIIHRDIKPANILLTNRDPPEWKLSDFGLSKIGEATTTFCGSPLYLAPEVGGLPFTAYTAAVDMWAVGVVGVEHTCGFASSDMELLRDGAKRDEWCEAVSQRSKRSPLATCLGKMLEIVPANRPCAINMVRRLEVWSPDQEDNSSTIVPRATPSTESRKRAKH